MIVHLGSVFVLLLAVWQVQQWPQSNPFVESTREEWQKAYRGWEPGPNVAAAVKRLDDAAGELRGQLSREEIALERFSVEWQRVSIHRHLLMCVALVATPRDEAPDLIVIRVNRDEIQRVFPSGKGKLPVEELKPNQIYETEPGSRRQVRYLTVYRWDDGEKFAVFARESDRSQ